jgi:hypothetical protein
VTNLSEPRFAHPENEPTQEEILAVVSAAVAQMLSSRTPSQAATSDPAKKALPWRFSGRWWATPLVLRRERPLA